MSLPLWERGLKSVISKTKLSPISSLPLWERGLKSDVGVPFKTANSTSLPLWERGLKFTALNQLSVF